MKLRHWGVVCCLTFAVVGAAISDISGTGSRNEMLRFGLLSFLLTDGPVDDADAVVLTFSGIELLDRNGQLARSIPINPPQTIDVLGLRGQLTHALVSNVEIETGEFGQVRLLVETAPADCQNLSPPFASYVKVGDTKFPLVVPGNSGLTFRGNIQAKDGKASTYVIDFDLRQSISPRGLSACFSLRPALRVLESERAGHISGLVDSELFHADHCTSDVVSGRGAAVYLYTDKGQKQLLDIAPGEGGPLATASVVPDRDGRLTYEMAYVPPGDYRLAFTCQASIDDPESRGSLRFESTIRVTVERGVDLRADLR